MKKIKYFLIAGGLLSTFFMSTNFTQAGTSRPPVYKCPGDPIALSTKAFTATNCLGTWSNSALSYPVTNYPSFSYPLSSASNLAPGSYSVSFSCYYGGISSTQMSYATLIMRQPSDEACSCSARPYTSNCVCLAGETRTKIRVNSMISFYKCVKDPVVYIKFR